ncbi:MAG: type II toxin-antitoxin system VapB family antitoxin [Candidatus Phosphoribacter sp.]
MALNIKNERVCRLAKEAARVSGLSQTSALEKALEAFLAEAQEERAREERMRRTQELIESWRGTVPDEDREWTRRFVSEMYDANGLPR